ncbi:hypothetical protein ADIARSV_0277 [Arcticibacter svalbardensis MN12-7]|uniref:SPOR domain-containing protein n=1 Tax=Arcticibacter svalbardensis MN12-7 TaxID=1150600 RepID=R9GY04_9SPHI|nr:hypothetical protein [Arcticibacter svalbardensis]EOR96548.1 hypothetical protein ADIARSV_0277 [Arcticibacter svalbardensis MN12-7]
MSKLIKFVLAVLFLSSVSTGTAFSQSPVIDSVYYAKAVGGLINYYQNSPDKKLVLYNGPEHRGYFRQIKGFAYFDTDKMVNGNVLYDHVWYKLPLLYDLVMDQVIILHYDGLYKMSLVTERVDQFNMNGHVFKKIGLTNLDSKMVPGFYEQIYAGDSISLYAKRSKIISELLNMQSLEREFQSKNLYYFLISGSYHSVNSKKEMYALLGSKKKAVVVYLRKNHVKFRKSKEAALVIASKKYDDKL